jgi:transketolase
MRKQFSKTMLEIGEDPRAVLLIGDISHYLLKDYEEKYKERFYNLGICEQSLIGMASGMSLSGFKPIVHTIAPFCVERAYEQIKIDLCYQNTDVTIISVGSSFDYSHLGCTHHCYSDISILRSLPNIDIFIPGNSQEFDKLFKATWANGRPKYFKLSNKEHNHNIDVHPYEHSIINEVKTDKILFVNGHLLQEVIEANQQKNTIVYLPTLSNLSYSIEENSEIGGLGDLLFEIASKNKANLNLKKIAIPNKFLTNYGKPEEHRDSIGLNIDGIKRIIND